MSQLDACRLCTLSEKVWAGGRRKECTNAPHYFTGISTVGAGQGKPERGTPAPHLHPCKCGTTAHHRLCSSRMHCWVCEETITCSCRHESCSLSYSSHTVVSIFPSCGRAPLDTFPVTPTPTLGALLPLAMMVSPT